MDILIYINNLIINVINNYGAFGPIISCVCIYIESIFAFLPLSLFITINFLSFGMVLGFLISWIFTVLGCITSFCLVRKFNIKLFKNKSIFIDNLSLEQIVILLSLPFTPAFLINICAGLSKISYKKYLVALIISKFFLVYFWGYLGTTLIECLTNKEQIVKVILMILISYFISKLVSKVLKVE